MSQPRAQQRMRTASALTVLVALAALLPGAASVSAPPDDSRAAALDARRGTASVRLTTRTEISNHVASRATVAVSAPDGVPAGRVVVRAGRRVLATADTAARPDLRLRLDLRPLRAGHHRLTAVFRSGGRTWGRSAPVTVTARRGCAWRPHSCGFASMATTGVPAGMQLTPSGSVTVDEPGAVVEGLDIDGTLTIRASDVTVRNTRVHGSAFQLVKVEDGATGVVLHRLEVDGEGREEGASGIVGGSPTITRTRVTGVENGFVPGTGTRIRHSYVHGLAAPGSPHYDGIQIDGDVRDISVTGSTVDVTDHGQTSAVMVDNYFGPSTGVVIDGNLLMGGGFTVYADGAFSGSDEITVSYTDNRMVAGHYGYSLVRGADVDWAGNVIDATGAPVRMRGGG